MLFRSRSSVVPSRAGGTTEERLGKLLAMARSRLAAEGLSDERLEPQAPAAEPLVGRAPLPGRRIASSIDDDLFEDAPAAFDRFAQDRLAGARR